MTKGFLHFSALSVFIVVVASIGLIPLNERLSSQCECPIWPFVALVGLSLIGLLLVFRESVKYAHRNDEQEHQKLLNDKSSQERLEMTAEQNRHREAMKALDNNAPQTPESVQKLEKLNEILKEWVKNNNPDPAAAKKVNAELGDLLISIIQKAKEETEKK